MNLCASFLGQVQAYALQHRAIDGRTRCAVQVGIWLPMVMCGDPTPEAHIALHAKRRRKGR